MSPFKVLVCGDRRWGNASAVFVALDALYEAHGHSLVVIEGGCHGADEAAQRWTRMTYGADLIEMKAEWRKYGTRAGPIRNERMLAEKPDLVLAFHNDLSRSKGTAHMVKIAKAAGVPVHVMAQQKGTAWNKPWPAL